MLLLKSTFFASIILLLSSSFLALNSSKINNLTNEKNKFISYAPYSKTKLSHFEYENTINNMK